MIRLLMAGACAMTLLAGSAGARVDPVETAQASGRQTAHYDVASRCGSEPDFYPSTSGAIYGLGSSGVSDASDASRKLIDWHNCRIGYFNDYIAKRKSIAAGGGEADASFWARKYMKEMIDAQRTIMTAYNGRLDEYLDAIEDRRAELRRNANAERRRTAQPEGPSEADLFYEREQKRGQCVYFAQTYPEPARTERIMACNAQY